MGGSIKIVLLYIILSYSFLGVAQNVFNQSFDEGVAPNFTSNALEVNQSIYFTQNIFINTIPQLEAIKLDPNGIVQLKKSIVIDSSFNIFDGYAGSLQFLSTSEFCQLYHIATDSGINLVFFDSNLNVIRDQRFDFNFFLNAGVIKQINDSTLLTLGRIKNTSTYDLFLINTDLQGNERWRNTFGTTGKDDYGYSIELINNKIIIGGQTSFTSQIIHSHIYQLNINGQLEVDSLYTELNNVGFLTYHPSFGLYLSGAIKNTSTMFPYIALINPDLSINWIHHFFTNDTFVNPGQMTINDNGIISIVGTKYINNEFVGWFFQTNQHGDSLNTKLIEHIPGNRAAFYDIRPTSDGGYIMAGETRAPSQDSWIVKVNSWGCDNIPCIVSVSEVNEYALGAFNCYPNPSSGLGTIKGNLKNSNRSSSEIRIYNTIGQLVDVLPIRCDDFDFQINFPNSGLYLIQLYQGNTMISSQKWVVH